MLYIILVLLAFGFAGKFLFQFVFDLFFTSERKEKESTFIDKSVTNNYYDVKVVQLGVEHPTVTVEDKSTVTS